MLLLVLPQVLLSVVAVLAEPEAPQRRPFGQDPAAAAPTLAYVAAPLVVGSQRAAPAVAAPAAALLAYTAPAASVQQQYVARTYNGITTLALEQQPTTPVAAPLIAAPASPVGPARIVVTGTPAAPARVVVAGAEPTVRYYTQSANLVFAAPSAPAAAPAARVLAITPQAAPAARVVAVSSEPAPAAHVVAFAPQTAPAEAVVAIAPEAPVSSSSQYFSRNYNGVPQVTYFVVGPAPVTAPVAVAPQQGALPARRPAPGRPGVTPVPAGEPVNQGDVEVLDA